MLSHLFLAFKYAPKPLEADLSVDCLWVECLCSAFDQWQAFNRWLCGTLTDDSTSWQSLHHIVDDIETDGGESTSPTSQGRSPLFVPNPLLTTGKDMSEFVSDPPSGWQQLL